MKQTTVTYAYLSRADRDLAVYSVFRGKVRRRNGRPLSVTPIVKVGQVVCAGDESPRNAEIAARFATDQYPVVDWTL